MNIYVVVEGVTETKVYPEWIKYVNKKLSKANYISDVVSDNFYIVSGQGYPGIYKIIDSAILDTNANHQFDRLVIALDSEDLDFVTRFNEIDQYVLAKSPRVQTKIIVQHFCFETWALGNRRFGPNNPKSEGLKAFKKIFDVTKNDPELLPNLKSLNLNRSKFAFQYLKLAIRDKGSHITYNKNRPDVVMHPKFFDEVKKRLEDTKHIDSFKGFLAAFI